MGLSRYGSAPGSFLSGLADSVVAGGGGEELSAVGSEGMIGRFFSGDSPCLTSESSCRASDRDGPGAPATGGACLQGPYAPEELQVSAAGSPLVRHSSSPAGFFSHLLTDHERITCPPIAGPQFCIMVAFRAADSHVQVR
ncbi:hypothetical protein BHE74_00054218 [Ensete ventricosum]|uniref:Uncharacterized protein n=1 Tax=Ensete ventricosum TaxID=4639 RepID=A0A444CLF4_ENSVE|nr:hypothetical protein GW17_00051370 [Ensete ventricosum]RWW40365.1 hypothetical protein BHE74_00054218 [Ensete ventricosum]RZR71453.1 hypothetical protein BHM03_00005343 [Ensete ventricosum]